MNMKKLLYQAITEELDRIEQDGEIIKLKTLMKKRIIYTLIFGVIFAAFFAEDNLICALIDLVIYFIVLYNINNVSVIAKIAKKSPNTPFSDIIRGDMK